MPRSRILPACLVLACIDLFACGTDLPRATDELPGGSAATEAATEADDTSAVDLAPAEVGADAIHPAAAAPITVWIAGDSTVANGSTPCPRGWGGHFGQLFNTGVTVVNSAVAGRSVRTWLFDVLTTTDSTGECMLTLDATGKPVLQARWQAMLTGIAAGDYLFIQFGINDSAPTCNRHVGLDAFKQSYGMMAQAARARGAHPIFVTPLSAIACTGTTAHGTRGGYVTATKDAGAQLGVPVIDLHQLSVDLYNASGFCPIPGGDVTATTTGPVGAFFCADHTHLEDAGAVRIAGLVATALRSQGIPLAAFLR
jgi:lysophospholipase L1-like esterase